MPEDVGRINFETNIAQVRDQIVQGMASISAALQAEASITGGW